jgi:spore maturation protein CgeB
MRILIPFQHYEDSSIDNIQDTLRDMGHEVMTLGSVNHSSYWSLPRYALRVAMQRMESNRLSRTERTMLRLAREFKPDMILAGVHSPLNPLVLSEFGRLCPGRRVLWWGDPPANSQKWGILDSEWDVVYLKDRVGVEKLKLAGRNAHMLNEAMNPRWHKPIATQQNESIVFIGNYYAFRQAIAVRLMEDGVNCQLYGSRPPRWAHPAIKQNYSGRYLFREEKSRVTAEGLACVNTFSLAEGDSMNMRAFETAGAAALQLIEYRPAVEECFEPGKEVLTFKSYPELTEHIERARKYPREMVAIREAGARRAHAEHTYRHRLEVILKNL